VASVNPALNARPFDFGYSFFSKDSTSGADTPIEAISGLRADTNKLYAQLPCTNPPVRQKLFIKVIASNPRLGCADSAFASFRFNPTPVSSFARVPGLCFGESVQIALNEPQDTGLYVYTWSSKTPTPKLGRKGIFTLTADTTNAVDAATGDVRRGKNDEFNVKVAFKKKFGGCAIKDQKQPVFVGSY
jgi:hypothetical protein